MSTDEATSTAGIRPGTRAWAAVRRRIGELVIVFVGVYAAFLLNRVDTERHDARRREQIVGALEREVSENVEELKGDLAEVDKEFGDFNRQLAAGAMPRLGISYTNSGYSASDDATLLQAGGLDLLDMQTLELMRKVNTLERELNSATHNQFELCLAALANHRNEDFYDPATQQLKAEYRWYPVIMRGVIGDAKTLLAAEQAFLTHLRSDRPAGASGPR